MIYVLLSLCALVIMVLFPHTPFPHLIDIIAPLLTALACTRTTSYGIVWLLCMTLIWGAFISAPWTLIFCAWLVAYYAVRLIARRVEWQRGDVFSVIVMGVSLVRNGGLLLLLVLTGRPVAVTWYTPLYLLANCISAGILAAYIAPHLLRRVRVRTPTKRYAGY